MGLLDEQMEDISLTSFQFIYSARLAIDMTSRNALKFFMAIKIVPEAVNRLAVINLKGFLDDGFDAWTEVFEKEHGIAFTGSSSWNENVIEYDYRLDDVKKALQLFLEGRL